MNFKQYLNESFGENEIEEFLRSCKVHPTEYVINPDFSVTVNGNIEIDITDGAKRIPIKLKHVSGTIFITGTIEKLVGLPEICNNLVITEAKIRDLSNCPKVLNELLIQRCDDFVSLKGCPQTLMNFEISNLPKLESLIGGPKEAKIKYKVENCSIKSIEGIASNIGNNGLILYNCKNLKSLQHIHKMIKSLTGKLDISGTNITRNLLGIYLINGLDDPENIRCKYGKNIGVIEIIKKAKKDAKDIFDLQDALIEAGLKDLAKT